MRTSFVLTLAGVLAVFSAMGVESLHGGEFGSSIPALKKSDVVFMSRADTSVYREYGATFLGWGGYPRSEAEIDSFVQRVQDTQTAGVRYAAGIGWLTQAAAYMDFAEDFLDAVCVNLEGERITVPWLWDHSHKGHPFYLFLDVHPSFQAFLERNTRWALRAKPDAFHMDDLLGSAAIGAANSKGGTFNREYITGFREFMKESVPRDSLNVYGIKNIDAFDYAEFLRHRSDRALIDYYNRYTLKSTIGVVEKIRDIMNEELGYAIPLSGNAAYSDWRHLPFAPYLDYLSCEVHEHAGDGLTGTPLLDYKIAEAFNKPIAATGFGRDWAFVKEHDVPGLVRGWIAQGYAFGQNYMAPNRQWCYTNELGTHWYYGRIEDYAPVYRFIRANAHLFDDYVPFEDVGILLSFTNYRRSQRLYQELPRMLASRNIPHGVLIAGDEWLDIRLTRDILRRYHTIIVPEDLILDAAQKRMLDRWTLQNTIVVWRGEEEFFRKYRSPFRIEGADEIWMVPRVKPGDDRAPVVIHLLNRNYRPESDSYDTPGAFTITIEHSAFPYRNFYRAHLYQYNKEPKEFRVRTAGNSIHVEVSGFDQWGILTLEGR